MVDQIEFEENVNFRSRTVLGQPQTPKMISFLVKRGIVKNEDAAGIILVSIIIISIFLTIYIFYNYVFYNKKQPPPLFSPGEVSVELNQK